MASNENRTKTVGGSVQATSQNLSEPGRFQTRHGAYTLRRLLRLSKPRKRADREMVAALRFDYALATGHPTWDAAPKPVQELIDMAIELSLFRRALFSGFWDGTDLPKRYDGVTELLRRVLVTLGLEPHAVAPDVAGILAAMRKSDRSDKPQPGATGEAERLS